ncbi:DnaB-like helicase C-terminal domain-containing protein (plasmid) [Entomospira nematocerorum]|uniref:SF4 helicase domain-containing protein n=1 Tax=Entomospira nematocerorum TaxID=2719987 RepID=A0A968KVT3_9SPIO|nr:DnaB-like helicase C-terminal domain-containing protein [Entomospira nematocera]NIZ47658.1 hypothetical protein [Entomospira nematocera]WDI34550.1 DnaB-like helicase C-terminal domain-containing protein [Entomospira nematocera]
MKRPVTDDHIIEQKKVTIDRLQQITHLGDHEALLFEEIKPFTISKRLEFLNLPEYRLLRPGTTIIGGEASSGKTTLSLQIAVDILLHNPKAQLLFFSLDESHTRAKRKLISLVLAMQNLLPSDKKNRRFNLAYEPLSSDLQDILASPEQQAILKRIHISDDAYFLDPINDAFINAVAHVSSQEVIIIIDYLQLLPKSGLYNSNLRENFNASLAYLKQQVNRLNNHMQARVLLLLLSQVSRSNSGSTFAFRETSEIENIADSALVLEYASQPKSQSTGRGKEKIISQARTLRLVKNKDGAKATFQAIMSPDIPFFHEIYLTNQRFTHETSIFRV